jgi:hypothetical protein
MVMPLNALYLDSYAVECLQLGLLYRCRMPSTWIVMPLNVFGITIQL